MDPFQSVTLNHRCDLFMVTLRTFDLSSVKFRTPKVAVIVIFSQKCSHPLLLHTLRCVPTLYHPGNPAPGTPRWPS